MVMTLHDTDEAAIERAVARIGKLQAVVEPPRIIRIENL
jgi:homoserine dehydrogenase